MMAVVSELSRRAVLRLGMGAALGAAGAYAITTVPTRPTVPAPPT